MAAQQRLICAASALVNGGRGVRFSVTRSGKPLPAFAVRHGGCVYAYVNACAHVGVELDWQEGEFFESSGLYLICATHGALYAPADGRCIEGPCRGKRLQAVGVVERDGGIYLKQDEEDHG